MCFWQYCDGENPSLSSDINRIIRILAQSEKPSMQIVEESLNSNSSLHSKVVLSWFKKKKLYDVEINKPKLAEIQQEVNDPFEELQLFIDIYWKLILDMISEGYIRFSHKLSSISPKVYHSTILILMGIILKINI